MRRSLPILHRQKERPELKETARDSLLTLWWAYLLAVAFLIFVGIVAVGGAFIERPLIDFRRESVQGSAPYVEGKVTALLTMAAEVERIDVDLTTYPADSDTAAQLKAQRATIVAQMRIEADRIPAEEVPARVRAILRVS